MLVDTLKLAAEHVLEQVIKDRRHLHVRPELSFHEYGTAEFIKSRLDEIGVEWQPVAGTGVVGWIRGEKGGGPLVVLRADIDALPITEAGNKPYASQNAGVMHACGHDAHTASLLGVASILQSMRSAFYGTVKLIFQPGEEVLPGGASLLLKEGVLEGAPPAAVIGQHVMPGLPCGVIGVHSGKFMASMDELRVTVYGRGGHGAQPHLNIDPVVISAQIIVALQQLVSRMANPTLPTVLSFGKVVANGAVNVIPDQVYMEGTFRTLDESWRDEAHARMKKAAEGIAAAMGGSCEFRIIRGYPFLLNEEGLTAEVKRLASEYVGAGNVVDPGIWMAAEDFAYYSQAAAGCFYLLGTGNEGKGTCHSLHTAQFDIDEDALLISTGLMAYIALRKLGN